MLAFERHCSIMRAMKTQIHFKPYQPNQLLLLPPDMKQWLPEDDLAYFIMDVVNELDLSANSVNLLV